MKYGSWRVFRELTHQVKGMLYITLYKPSAYYLRHYPWNVFLREMLKGFGCCLIVLVSNTVLLHRMELIMHPRLALNLGFSCLSLSSRDWQAWDRYHISLHRSILNTTCGLQIHSVKFFSYKDMLKLELTQFTIYFHGS